MFSPNKQLFIFQAAKLQLLNFSRFFTNLKKGGLELLAYVSVSEDQAISEMWALDKLVSLLLSFPICTGKQWCVVSKTIEELSECKYRQPCMEDQGDQSTGALHLVPQFPDITGGHGTHTHDTSGFKVQFLKAQRFSVSKLSTSHPRTELFIVMFSPSGPTQPPTYQKVSHVLFKFHFPKEDTPDPSAHHDPYFITASARTALDTAFTVSAWICIFFFVKLYTSNEVTNAQLSSQSPAQCPLR